MARKSLVSPIPAVDADLTLAQISAMVAKAIDLGSPVKGGWAASSARKTGWSSSPTSLAATASALRCTMAAHTTPILPARSRTFA